MQDLNGRRVVITGGSQGPGLAACGANGARMVVSFQIIRILSARPIRFHWRNRLHGARVSRPQRCTSFESHTRSRL
jgi:hypothetical protein